MFIPFFKPLHFIPENPGIDFVGWRRFGYGLSLFLCALSLALIIFKGLNFGIDFKGGIVMEVQFPETVDVSTLREEVNGLNLGEASIQTFGSPNDIMIRLPQFSEEEGAQEAVIAKVKELLTNIAGEEIDYRRLEYVGPAVGQELIRTGVIAVGLALLAIMGYIWMRFEWHFGLWAVIALLHDVIITLGVFALIQMEFNLSTIAAVLTIAGYSINDTVVVFDRVRENLERYKKKDVPAIINDSLNETLSRTTLTAGTTLLALLALYFLGGNVIASFSFAMILGVVVGTYSSLFIASPLLLNTDLRAIHQEEDLMPKFS